MKNWLLGALCGWCALTVAVAGELKTEEQKAGYALGLVLSQQSQQIFGPALKMVDLAAMGEGLADGLNQSLNDQPVKLQDEEIKKILEVLNGKMRTEVEKEQEQLAKKVAENRTLADKFLAENQKKPGVKTTDSGLQYIVVKAGDGATPKDGDSVSVHYAGRLTDGTEFDSSIKRNEPFEFEYPGPVIPGWNEALALMKAGGKMTVFLPPALAYGDFGAPPAIPPASVLVFDIELLKVSPADPNAKKAAAADTANKK